MNWKFEFADQHLSVIARALQKLPYEESVATIAELQRQVNAQRPRIPDGAPPVKRNGKTAEERSTGL